MRYEPRAPREGINVSARSPLGEFITLLAGLLAVLVVLGVAIGLGVDVAVRFIPPDFESRVFSGLEEELSPEAEASQRALQELLERLAAHWPECPYRLQASLMESEMLNAAALPGGRVLVTTGLLSAVGSENELAFVLGHELGHFQGRHHLRRLGRRVVYGLALAALLGRAGNAGDLGSSAGELTSRGFDRGQESDADAFGLGLVAAEYGHVAGAAELFEHLPGGGPGLERLAAYLSTHPAGRDRSERIEALARERGWPVAGEIRPLGEALRTTVTVVR